MDYIQKYIEWKATYAPRAAVNYRVPLTRFKEFIRKDFPRATIDDVVRFQNLMQDRYSASRAAYSVIVLKNFFKFWEHNGKRMIDPYLLRVPRMEHHSHAAVSPEEFKRMEATISVDDFYGIEKLLILRLLWETGMRVSELSDLNLSNVDSEKRKAFIPTKKTKRPRWIMWSEKTHWLMCRYLGVRICLNQQPALFIAGDRGGRRDRISVRTIQRWVKEIAADANIVKKVSPHSFRHAKAHRILDLGGNPKHISAILGHSENNPMAAFSYLRLNETEFEKIAEQFLV